MPKKPHTPQAILEGEVAARIKRGLHEEVSPPSAATLPGIGHNGGPSLPVPAAPVEPPLLAVSVVETAQRLGISRNGAYALVASGAIPSLRLGNRLLIPTRALDALLDGAVEAWRQRQQV